MSLRWNVMDKVSINQPGLKKNISYRLLYEILKIILSITTYPYAARILRADGMGIYSFTHSIITYFTLVAALGTSAYGMREIARHRDDPKQASKLFWEIELMTVMTSTFCLAAWCFVVIFGRSYQIYFLTLTPILLGTMFDISWFFTGYEQIKCTVVANMIVKTVGLMSIFIFVKEKKDLIIYFVINSVTILLGNASMWFYLPKKLVKVDFRELRFGYHLRETMIYFIPEIAISVYTVLDKTLIGVISGSAYENGCYELATNIIAIMKSVVFSSLNYVMGARMSYLYEKGHFEEIKRRLQQSMSFILWIGFGALFGILAVAKTFVPLFFGVGYDGVIPILRIMSLLIVIIGISNCIGSQYLRPSGQRNKSAKIIITGSIVNLIMNLILIPLLGAVGATIASVIAELLITILYIYLCEDYMTLGILWELGRKYLLAGMVMCGVVYFFGEYANMKGIYLITIQVIMGAAIYFSILLLIKDNMEKELLNICKKILCK